MIRLKKIKHLFDLKYIDAHGNEVLVRTWSKSVNVFINGSFSIDVPRRKATTFLNEHHPISTN